MELEICNLTKKYKDKTAVNNVSLKISPGVWGLLGANGAGKTTLIRMITGIMAPTSGDILYDGMKISVLKGAYGDILGYLPQDFGFYPEFTVMDYLEYMSALKGLTKRDTKTKIDELLEILNLTEERKKKISKLSGGMKRRVGIAQALLNDPEVLILDEPTSGSVIVGIIFCILPFILSSISGSNIMNWIRMILPAGGAGIGDSFGSELVGLTFLKLGSFSFWPPYVMIGASIVSIPLFITLSILSYFRHEAA